MSQAIASYSPIRRAPAGSTLYVSGQIPLLPSGSLLSATLTEEVNLSLNHLEALLRSEGASLTDVVKTTVFLTDPADYAEMDAAYRERFAPGSHPDAVFPAREAVFVLGLPKGARVEISAIAVVNLTE